MSSRPIQQAPITQVENSGVNPQKKNVYMAREFVAISKAEKVSPIKIALAISAIVLIVSIILWAVGAEQVMDGVLLSGQILFGFALTPVGFALMVVSCLCCSRCCQSSRTMNVK